LLAVIPFLDSVYLVVAKQWTHAFIQIIQFLDGTPQYSYLSIEDSEVVLVFERNNAGLKKPAKVLSEQTSDSPAFLNATCPTKVCTQP
jgi:hypothetical protein